MSSSYGTSTTTTSSSATRNLLACFPRLPMAPKVTCHTCHMEARHCNAIASRSTRTEHSSNGAVQMNEHVRQLFFCHYVASRKSVLRTLSTLLLCFLLKVGLPPLLLLFLPSLHISLLPSQPPSMPSWAQEHLF